MAKVFLSKEDKLADKIIRCLPPQTKICEAFNETQQTISYRMNNVYRKRIREAIILFDLAGFEIKEKET